jgi:hypothetical protein
VIFIKIKSWRHPAVVAVSLFNGSQTEKDNKCRRLVVWVVWNLNLILQSLLVMYIGEYYIISEAKRRLNAGLQGYHRK